MKYIYILLMGGVFMVAAPIASAAEPIMPAERQSCTKDSECTFVSLTCGNACANVPISTKAKAAMEPTLRNQCGGTLPEETDMICHMNPPLQAACINHRCTVGYAFENHAGMADYQTSEAPQSAATKP